MIASGSFDPTAEIAFELRAPTLASLLVEAGHRLASVERRGKAPAESGEWREITVEAPDREALLVAWLNELIYLVDAEQWLPNGFEPMEVAPTRCRMRVRGRHEPALTGQVKAATHHALAIRDLTDGMAARVVLDV
jgi:SHS2 domain-containing protein